MGKWSLSQKSKRVDETNECEQHVRSIAGSEPVEELILVGVFRMFSSKRSGGIERALLPNYIASLIYDEGRGGCDIEVSGNDKGGGKRLEKDDMSADLM